jgi:hypothetical protein
MISTSARIAGWTALALGPVIIAIVSRIAMRISAGELTGEETRNRVIVLGTIGVILSLLGWVLLYITRR